MLRIENLTKTYGDKRAVDDLTLSIRPGEICAFIGHNGAGKTTAIKSVCGVIHFDSGEIYIDGISIKDDPIACKRLIAYIPDNPDLYEFLSGIKYLISSRISTASRRISAGSGYINTPICSS